MKLVAERVAPLSKGSITTRGKRATNQACCRGASPASAVTEGLWGGFCNASGNNPSVIRLA